MPRTLSKNAALGSGQATVTYTHTNGRSFSAIVTGEGGGANQLNLRIPVMKGTALHTLTNVDKRTTGRGGAGYLGRWSV